jgi:general secretion pathway protein G
MGIMNCRAGHRSRVSRTLEASGDAITTSPHHHITPFRRLSFVGRSGFTLIELLVVLSIIMVLASMGLAQYRNSIQHSKEAVLKQDLFLMRDAIDQYYADKGQYPSTLDALASDGYVRSIPKDPITDSTTTWQSVPAEPNPNSPTVEPGVFDVKSGSEKTALDGSKYADW